MLNTILKNITRISDIEEVNSSNYLESIGYIDNVYRFVTTMNSVFSKGDVEFKPSFYGEATSQKYNLEFTNRKASEMKVFKITSPLFSEDNIEEYKYKITEKLGSALSTILEDNLEMTIILE